MIPVKFNAEGFTLPVRVTPQAAKNEMRPYQDGDEYVQVRVTVPPEAGKANQAVAEVLAKALGLPKSSVTLLAGAKSRNKTFMVKTNDPKRMVSELALALKSNEGLAFTVHPR